jgi:uncharacterized protein
MPDEPILDRTEQRIIGTMLEKAHTTPDAYPLTLNALVAGCSQKSNRDPVIDMPEHHIEGALKALFVRGWVEHLTREGGRVARWGHRVPDRLGLSPDEEAVIAELLLRGPQSPGELRTRASRMHPIPSPDVALDVLGRLSAREVPLVEQLPQRPRERSQRWRHLLGTVEPIVEQEKIEPQEAPARPAPLPVETPAPDPAGQDRIEALEALVHRLREEVESLRAEVSSLRDPESP